MKDYLKKVDSTDIMAAFRAISSSPVSESIKEIEKNILINDAFRKYNKMLLENRLTYWNFFNVITIVGYKYDANKVENIYRKLVIIKKLISKQSNLTQEEQLKIFDDICTQLISIYVSKEEEQTKQINLNNYYTETLQTLNEDSNIQIEFTKEKQFIKKVLV